MFISYIYKFLFKILGESYNMYINSYLRYCVKFFLPNNPSRSIVINNENIKLKQLISKKQLDRGNKIYY